MLEKFHLRVEGGRGESRSWGPRGGKKLEGGGKDFFSFKQGGDWPWTLDDTMNITQGFLLVSLLWYQKVVNKSPILSLSLYLGLFFISLHQ